MVVFEDEPRATATVENNIKENESLPEIVPDQKLEGHENEIVLPVNEPEPKQISDFSDQRMNPESPRTEVEDGELLSTSNSSVGEEEPEYTPKIRLVNLSSIICGEGDTDEEDAEHEDVLVIDEKATLLENLEPESVGECQKSKEKNNFSTKPNVDYDEADGSQTIVGKIAIDINPNQPGVESANLKSVSCKIPTGNDLESDIRRNINCQEKTVVELESEWPSESGQISVEVEKHLESELRPANYPTPVVKNLDLESEMPSAQLQKYAMELEHEVLSRTFETVQEELTTDDEDEPTTREYGTVSATAVCNTDSSSRTSETMHEELTSDDEDELPTREYGTVSATAVSNTDSSSTEDELDVQAITDTVSSSSDTNHIILAPKTINNRKSETEPDSLHQLSLDEFKSGIQRTYLALNEGSESPKYPTEEEYQEKYDNYANHISSNAVQLLKSFKTRTELPSPKYNHELTERPRSKTEEEIEVEDGFHDMFENSGTGKDDDIEVDDSNDEESHHIELNPELPVNTDVQNDPDLRSATPELRSSRMEHIQPETKLDSLPVEISLDHPSDIQPIRLAVTSPSQDLQPRPTASPAVVLNEPSQPEYQVGATPASQSPGNLNPAPVNNMGMGGMANMAFQNPLFQFSTFLAAMQTMGMNPFMNFAGLPNPSNSNANPAPTAAGMPPMENSMTMQTQMAAFANMFQQFLNAQTLANSQLLNAQTLNLGQPIMSPQYHPIISPASVGAPPQPALICQNLVPGPGTQQPFNAPNFGNFGIPFGQIAVPAMSVTDPSNPIQSVPVQTLNLNPFQHNAVLSNSSIPITVSASAAQPCHTVLTSDPIAAATAIPQSEPSIRIRTDVLEKRQDPVHAPKITQDSRACDKPAEGIAPKRKISLENYRSKNKSKDAKGTLAETEMNSVTPAENKLKDETPAQIVPATSSTKPIPDKSKGKDTWKTYDEAKSIPNSRPLISGYMEVVHPTKPIRREKTPPPPVIQTHQPPISNRNPPELPVKKSARDFFDSDFESKLKNVKSEPNDDDLSEEDIKPDIFWDMTTGHPEDSLYSRSGSVGDHRQSFDEADRYSTRSEFDTRTRSSYRDTERHSSSGSDPRVRSNASSLDAGEEEDLRVRLEAKRGRGVGKNNRFERSLSRSPQRRFGRTPERVRHREDNGSNERSPDSRTQDRQGQGQFNKGRGRGFNRNEDVRHTSGNTRSRYDHNQRSAPEAVSRKYERSDQSTRNNRYDRSVPAQDSGKQKYDRSGQDYRNQKYDKRGDEVGKFDRSSGKEDGRSKHKYDNRRGRGSNFKSRGLRGNNRGNTRIEPEKYFNTEAEDWEADVTAAATRRFLTPDRVRSKKFEARSPIRGSSSRKRNVVDQPDQPNRRSRTEPDAKKPRHTIPGRPVTPEPAYIPEPGTENYFNSRFEDWDSEVTTTETTGRNDDSKSSRETRRRNESDDIQIRIPPPPVAVPITQLYYVTGDQPMSRDYAYKVGVSERERGLDIYDRPRGSGSTSVARHVEYVTTTSRVPFVPSVSYGQSGKRYVIQEEGGVVYDYMHGNGNKPLLLSARDRGIGAGNTEGYRTVKPGQGSGSGAPPERDPRFDWEDDD